MNGGDLVRRFFGAMQAGDVDAARELVRDDFLMVWPQSGERFSGRDNAFAAMASQTDKPEPQGDPRIVGSGDLWVVQMQLRYASGPQHYVAILELRDGRIARATGYWGAPFPAQQARAAFAEKA